MYRPFREFINDRVGAAITECCPSFGEVKSLARSGGRAFRHKGAEGRTVVFFLTHVSDRDRFSLALGWTKDPKFKAWDELAWDQAMGGRALMQSVRKAAQTQPTSLWQVHVPGLLVAHDCSAEPRPGEVEIDEGVPWQLIAELLQTSEPAAGRVGVALEPAVVESLRRGDVPPWAPANPAVGLREPFRLQSRLVSWESWFEFILCRPASVAEVEAITALAMAEARLQVQLLSVVARALVEHETPTSV